MRILAIEDNQADADLLSEYLQDISDNIQLDNTISLEESFSLLQKKSYDLIFLDLRLPDSDGLETVERLTDFLDNNINKKDIPIVVLTGINDYGLGKAVMKSNIKEFLVKDEMTKDLLERAIKFYTYGRLMPERRNGNNSKTYAI